MATIRVILAGIFTRDSPYILILQAFVVWHGIGNKQVKQKNGQNLKPGASNQSEHEYLRRETMTTTNKSVAKTRTNKQTAGYDHAQVSRGAATTVGVAGAVIGMWSFASIVGALVVTGGPISLAQSWFGAVIGM